MIRRGYDWGSDFSDKGNQPHWLGGATAVPRMTELTGSGENLRWGLLPQGERDETVSGRNRDELPAAYRVALVRRDRKRQNRSNPLESRE